MRHPFSPLYDTGDERFPAYTTGVPPAQPGRQPEMRIHDVTRGVPAPSEPSYQTHPNYTLAYPTRPAGVASLPGPPPMRGRPPSEIAESVYSAYFVTTEKDAYPRTQRMGSINALNSRRQPLDAKGQRQWNTELLSCCDHFETCFLAFCCPCILYGEVRTRQEYIDHYGMPHPTGGRTCTWECLLYAGSQLLCLNFIVDTMQRSDLRQRYSISGSTIGDCLTTALCRPCVQVQMSRELQDEEMLSHYIRVMQQFSTY